MKHHIRTEQDRARVLAVVSRLPLDPPQVVEIKAAKQRRSLDQNARMWAMLGDISRQVKWHGITLTPENWKDMFTASLKRQQVVPGLDGGFVVLGTSTRRMTVAEMAELIEFMTAFGLERGVVFKDPTFPTEETI